MSPPNTTLEPGELDSTMEFSGTPEIPAEADAFDDEADEVVDDLAMAAMAAGVDFVPQTLNVAVTAEVEMQNGKAAEAVPEIPATVEEAKGPDEFTISSTSRVVAPSTEEKEYVDLDTEIVDTEIIDAEAAFRIDNKPDESNLKISYRRADEEDQNKASSSSDSSDDSSSDEDDEQGDPETMPDSDFNPDASDSDSDSDSDILPSTKMTLEEREKLLIAMESMGAEDEDGVPGGELPKTKNEIELPPVEPLPISVVPEEMPLEEIGTIHSLVGENLIVEAKVSGEYRVLDVDSILCFADRSVLGRVGTPLPFTLPLFTNTHLFTGIRHIRTRLATNVPNPIQHNHRHPRPIHPRYTNLLRPRSRAFCVHPSAQRERIGRE